MVIEAVHKGLYKSNRSQQAARSVYDNWKSFVTRENGCSSEEKSLSLNVWTDPEVYSATRSWRQETGDPGSTALSQHDLQGRRNCHDHENPQ